MSWATNYIKELKAGKTIQFRPKGRSMTGLIDHNQLVTVEPYAGTRGLLIGQCVLCKVGGNDYLHQIKALDGSRAQIGELLKRESCSIQ